MSVRYEWAVSGPRSSGPVSLWSPELDLEMHGGDRVNVLVEEWPGQPDPGRLPVASFQMQSVLDYLARQAHYRQLLEREIRKHLAGLGPDYLPEWATPGCEVWSHVRVVLIYVRPLQVASRAECRAKLTRLRPDISEETIERFYQRTDRPETRSRITIHLDARWKDEHERSVDVRDGEVVSFSS